MMRNGPAGALALLLFGALVLLSGLPARLVEAVDAVPPLTSRIRQPVRADGRLLYVANGQIMEWSEGASRPLTRPGQRLEGATWSPDARLIATSDVGDNHSDIYLLEADGTPLRQLTRHWSHVSIADSAWGRKPVFASDSGRLFYVSDLGRTDMSLWSVSTRGGDNRREWTLPVGSAGLDWPSVSPDGKRIAFVSYPSGTYAPPQVFVLTLATRALQQLTDLKDGAFDPAWSPDGQSIAFAGRSAGRTNILTIGVDGTGLRRLTDGRYDRAPAWAPDGAELAFVSLEGASFDLFAIRVSGAGASDPRALTSGQKVDAISGVAWARADGRP